MNETMLILELEELLGYDMATGNMEVDKYIFDAFVANAYVNVHFVEDKFESRICQYKMIWETHNGIVMEYLGDNL